MEQRLATILAEAQARADRAGLDIIAAELDLTLSRLHEAAKVERERVRRPTLSIVTG